MAKAWPFPMAASRKDLTFNLNTLAAVLIEDLDPGSLKAFGCSAKHQGNLLTRGRIALKALGVAGHKSGLSLPGVRAGIECLRYATAQQSGHPVVVAPREGRGRSSSHGGKSAGAPPERGKSRRTRAASASSAARRITGARCTSRS